MTDTKLSITVQPRDTRGKQTKAARRKGSIPCNIFGLNEASTAISVAQKELLSLVNKAGETNLIYVTVEGEKDITPVLVDEVQEDVLTGNLVHVSFKRVSLKDKITATIPVEMVGELEQSDLVANLVLDEIEVEALPTDLPDVFEVDISSLNEVGDTILVKDLSYDRSKVTLMLEAEQLDGPLVTIQAVAEEPEPVAEDDLVEGEEAPEGEEPAQDGETTEADQADSDSK